MKAAAAMAMNTAPTLPTRIVGSIMDVFAALIHPT
jgi:hypothetical protein